MLVIAILDIAHLVDKHILRPYFYSTLSEITDRQYEFYFIPFYIIEDIKLFEVRIILEMVE